MNTPAVPHDPGPDPARVLELDRCRWWHCPVPAGEAFATVARDADLPATVVDAMRATPARPHLALSEGWRIWSLAPVSFQPANAQVTVGHLGVATDGTRVLTCRGLPELTADEFVAHVAERSALLPQGPDQVVRAIFAEVLEGAGRVLSELDDAVEDIEAAVFAPLRGSHAERIYRLKREVQTVRRSVGPLPELFGTSAGMTSDLDVYADHEVGFPKLHARAQRLVEQVVHADDLLDSVLAAHHTQVTIQQNDDMRRISAWVAIVAAPTAIASIYGMNFRYMPELGTPLGYPGGAAGDARRVRHPVPDLPSERLALAMSRRRW